MSTENTHQDRIRRRLDDCATVVGRPNLWPEIRRRLATQTPGRAVRRSFRVQWATGVIVAALVIGTGVYAGSSLLKGAYEINPAWQRAAENSHPVHLTQTQDDCTVTIEQVYADAELVVIGFTVQSSAGMSVAPGDAWLTTDDGTVLPRLDGGGYAAPESRTTSWLLSFDPSAMAAMPSELRARLTLKLSGVVVEDGAGPTAQPMEAEGEAQAFMLSPIKATPYGPFTFELVVPVSK